MKNYVEKFTNFKVLIIGDAILDIYIQGNTDRICREAPVPVFDVEKNEQDGGGAANTAINLAALGAETWFLTVLGEDEAGTQLTEVLELNKVCTDYILKDKERKTLVKKRVTASSNILLRIDEGNTDSISQEYEKRLIETIEELYFKMDAIILSDYGYGIITDNLISRLEKLRSKKGKILVADSKFLDRFKSLHPSAVKPNYEETVNLLNIPKLHDGERVAQVLENQKKLFEVTGAKCIAATMDKEGIVLFEKGKEAYRILVVPHDNKKAIGAGDTFISALTLALCSGASFQSAGEIACAAVRIIMEKNGTVGCTLNDLKGYYNDKPKYLALEELKIKVDQFKKDGKRIVFTNGCFDIIHKGHVFLLNQSKLFGDILIVGINSDASVKRLKGNSKPINDLHDRISVLSGLGYVDYLTSFEEDTPETLIKVLKPDVFVKGGDYTLKTIPEAPLVQKLKGEVKIIPLIEDHSTTHIINKIRDITYPKIELNKTEQLNERPQWKSFKNILCVRMDNLGDVLMTSPSIRTLKEAVKGRKITLLTSSSGAAVAAFLPEISECITFDPPWVKNESESSFEKILQIVEMIRARSFDAAVIFTVYSQNPLPAAMICHMAGIKNVSGYCRENPYNLMNCWYPDPEPFDMIRHEVDRQMELVRFLGATSKNDKIQVNIDPLNRKKILEKLKSIGLRPLEPWVILHPGASEIKRQYPIDLFSEAVDILVKEMGMQVVLTGIDSEKPLTGHIKHKTGSSVFDLAGNLPINELFALISCAPLLISNNTGPVHIASAVGTPVVVLYAITNPQHAPWKVPHKILPFDVPENLKSKNIIIQKANEKSFLQTPDFVQPADIVFAAKELLKNSPEYKTQLVRL